ncbi:flagellar biosynthetic protein FliR [Burkholderia dolosa]|uniref:flagellar biosynthetic protein FliR n=1 Tax=Burkholderia dolosa TaxID=152500 RepID=UPI002013BBB8|nr:flagellar biosynthetic protein FliR [Burkholderia dolosa]
MELLLPDLMRIAAAIIWPFCRIAAALAAAPILGDAMIPMRARALAALVLAFTVQPGIPAGPSIEPLSPAAVAVIGEQVAIGALLGFAFHLVLSVLLSFGSIVSSQIGLSMAQMNDPMNGQSSDVLSNVMYVLFILLFFAVDGHLLMTQVLARSFDVWPIGSSAFDFSALRRFVFAVGWMFSAAAALALPVTFATLVVQVGLGLLNRAAPTLNLFSLGFSVTTMFGLLLVVLLLPSLPDHYHRMVIHVLDVYDGLAGAGAEDAR